MNKNITEDQQETVYVMLSGGVDSSVAAYLLKSQGYQVVGVFMKNWSNAGEAAGFKCPWREDQADARRVAEILDIPFYTFNFEKAYRARVAEYMKQEYASGRTPNPDILCNEHIKFGLFLEKALELGADYIATGHYARLRREFPISESQFPRKAQNVKHKTQKVTKLLRAKDEHKDQTYFLWRLTQEQLRYTLFPLGGIKDKREVRQMAAEADLPTSQKADSQGVCFIGEIPVQQFLLETVGEKPGVIKRIGDGRVLGWHRGAHLYTRGQRKGLGIGGGIPHYVADTNVQENTVFVVPKKQEHILYDTNLKADNVNLICDKESLEIPGAVMARIRHGQSLQPAVLENIKDGIMEVRFRKPQRAITAGQSVVLYDKTGEEMLGGGIIR